MERSVREPAASAESTANRHSHCARDYFWTALSNLPFCCGSGARAARGSFRAYRRYLSPLVVELQLLSRGLGWLHRAVWYGGANRCGDGDLSERSGGTKTGTGWRNDSRNSNGGSNRRRTAPSAAKGHDSINRG